MRSRYGPRAGVAGVLVLAMALAGCGASTKDELVIGEYGSLTGGDATFGQSTKAGVEVALDELIAQHQGKIGGMTVRAVVEDDQGRPEEAASVVQKLINQDRVITVIGEVASSRSLAGGPICQSNGVPMISPSSTNPGVTQVGLGSTVRPSMSSSWSERGDSCCDHGASMNTWQVAQAQLPPQSPSMPGTP